jgi:hypothetical protein
MKHTTPTILLLLGAGFTGGCPAQDRDAADGSKARGSAEERRDEAKEKVRTETKEAAQAMRDYVYAERTEFVAEMKKDLAAAQADLDRLSAEVDRSSGEAKAKAKLELDAAREKWAQAKVRLDAAESATEDTWEDVKRGFKESQAELKKSIANTRQWLSDEIEP